MTSHSTLIVYWFSAWCIICRITAQLRIKNPSWFRLVQMGVTSRLQSSNTFRSHAASEFPSMWFCAFQSDITSYILGVCTYTHMYTCDKSYFKLFDRVTMLNQCLRFLHSKARPPGYHMSILTFFCSDQNYT